MIYEGEFLNGKRNGNGKEYINDRLEFEGQFLCDYKYNGKGYDDNKNIVYEVIKGNGKVKEYYDGKLEFEGEYFNGKKNGKAKEYDKFGYRNLVFEGEYLNGFKNGKGKEYDGKGELIFEGEYKNGKKL